MGWDWIGLDWDGLGLDWDGLLNSAQLLLKGLLDLGAGVRVGPLD